MTQEKYQIISHTADLQLKFFGNSFKELFENAVYGMFDAIKPHYLSKDLQEFTVEIKASNRELLLVDFLSEALYLSDAHSVAFKKAQIKQLTENDIKATLQGSSISGFDVVEIKAVTYHNLEIVQHNNEWSAQVVFDI